MKPKRIERIEEMEARLDRCSRAADELAAACERWQETLPDAKELTDYYFYGDWRADYEADEAGELPEGLRRGVLSEDAIYNYTLQVRELTKELLRIALSALEL